ncbi:hypothetical protein TrLO_g12083 [Triparma laevis f. longispina]|uniref:C2H2-type domain-containing protein n=1 Tax=Triparma laevis f. longispina TaxID=1714387 RepID=A0A9W7FPS4_9STRA|nr:hypothetical protein TrLO_g12083 [Triparma laevis f. longispina]
MAEEGGGIIVERQEIKIDVKYTELEFDGNETPLSADEDRSVAGSVITGIAGEAWDDDTSVASEGVDSPLRKKAWNSYKTIEGVEGDKWGRIIRTCGIVGCQYKAGQTANMNKHKAAKHGINVVWFSCDQDNCDYKIKDASNLKRRKQQIHNIGVVWHQRDSCDYRAKQANHLKQHIRRKHE